MKDLNSLYSPEIDTLRKIGSAHKGSQPLKNIYHGLVVYVDRAGIDGRVRFSCKIKVIGASNPDNQDWESFKFYPPLLPPHVCAVPEVGEEVLLICEEPGNLTTAYWVNRISNSNKLRKTEIGDSIDTDDNLQTRKGKYGSVTLPEEKDVSPNPKYPDNNPRVKAGDVVQQGRSNTFLRHSFDVKNKKGTLEIITEEGAVAKTERTNLNYRRSGGARTLYATLSDIDSLVIQNLYGLQFDPDFTKNGGQKNLDSAYLLLEALELRLISRQGKKVQHAVLAEEQERWLIQLIEFLKKLVDDIDYFRTSVFEIHSHMANGQTSPPILDGLTNSKSSLSQKLATDKSNFDKHKQPIPDHHSKKVALN